MGVIYSWPHSYKGKVIGEIRRLPSKRRGGKADLPFYYKNGKGFEAGIPENLKPVPLFGIDSVVDGRLPVCIVEGQKVQHAFEGLRFQAVSSVSGASAASLGRWRDLVEKDCKVFWYFPDNDDAGHQYCSDVFSTLRVALPDAEHRYIKLPGLKPKGDLCDWLAGQPELRDWNQLDPLGGMLCADDLRKRVLETVDRNNFKVPEWWGIQHNWGIPEVLSEEMPAVHSLRLEMLPEELRDRARDVAYQMQCPVEYIAVALVVMLGAAVGAGCGVRPKRRGGWIVVPNMWGAIVGPPGSMKSEALNQCMEPLHAIEAGWKDTEEEEQRRYLAEKAAYDAKASAIKERMRKRAKTDNQSEYHENQDIEALTNLTEPPDPPKRRLVTDDATVEKIVDLARQNPRGLIFVKDEITEMLTSWLTENRKAYRSFFLKGWNGNSRVTHDRIGRGTIVAENLCISIMGGIQPDLLKKFLLEEAEHSNDGLLQRFQLAIYPDQIKKRVSIRELDEADDDERAAFTVAKIAQDIWKMDFKKHGARKRTNDKIPWFRFDDEAQKFYYEWFDDLDKKILEESRPLMQQHLVKYRSLMPSLAMIFHLVRLADTGVAGDITFDCAQRAAGWCAILEEHARRIYGLAATSRQESAIVLAKHIAEGKSGRRFRPRDIQRSNLYKLPDAAAVKAACKELVDMNWLRQEVVKEGRTGPATTFYVVNPAIEFADAG